MSRITAFNFTLTNSADPDEMQLHCLYKAELNIGGKAIRNKKAAKIRNQNCHHISPV